MLPSTTPSTETYSSTTSVVRPPPTMNFLGLEERQNDQPILLSICEADLEEVSGHEREQHTRRQLLIPSPEERQSEQPTWVPMYLNWKK